MQSLHQYIACIMLLAKHILLTYPQSNYIIVNSVHNNYFFNKKCSVYKESIIKNNFKLLK